MWSYIMYAHLNKSLWVTGSCSGQVRIWGATAALGSAEDCGHVTVRQVCFGLQAVLQATTLSHHCAEPLYWGSGKIFPNFQDLDFCVLIAMPSQNTCTDMQQDSLHSTVIAFLDAVNYTLSSLSATGWREVSKRLVYHLLPIISLA